MSIRNNIPRNDLKNNTRGVSSQERILPMSARVLKEFIYDLAVIIRNLEEFLGYRRFFILKIVVITFSIMSIFSIKLDDIAQFLKNVVLVNESFPVSVTAIVVIASVSVIYSLFSMNSRVDLRKEKRERDVRKRSMEKGISREEATVEIDKEIKVQIEEDKKSELVSGFLRVLDYHRSLTRFYIWAIIIFSLISMVCVAFIFGISQSNLYVNIDYKDIGQMITEGFFKNIRFFIYESILITLLGYSLKRISAYISMIEVYKEFQIFTIMDVQRQNRNKDEDEKYIVSKDFQDRFALMLSKHYDFIINNKMDIKLKTDTETLNEFVKCVNKEK